MRVVRLLAVVALLGAAGCWRAASPPTTSLRLSAATTPKAAKVTVNDQPIGSLDFVMKRGVALPPGKHRITVEAPGYLPWDAEVDAGENGGLVKLDVVLVPIPD